MKHVNLSPDERTDVLAYWRDFIKSGGEGDAPSAFQLDALNDSVVRDAILFWHLGGNPFAHEDSAWKDEPRIGPALEVLGPVPTDYTKVIMAMTKAVDEVNASSPDLGHIDTATVLVLAHVMMAMLLKRFDDAKRLLTDIIDVNLRLAQKDQTHELIHNGPLEAMALALSIIAATADKGEDAAVEQMLKDVFAVKQLPVLTGTNNN